MSVLRLVQESRFQWYTYTCTTNLTYLETVQILRGSRRPKEVTVTKKKGLKGVEKKKI